MSPPDGSSGRCRAPGDGHQPGLPAARVGTDEAVTLWPFRNGHPTGALPVATLPTAQPLSAATALAFSQDGTLLAAGGMDGAVTVLEIPSLSRVTSFRAHERGRTWGSESQVTGLVFRRDGRTLLSAGNDGIVRSWEARSGKPKGRPLRGHEGGVAALALAPDDRTLASGGVDERVAIWDLEQADGSASRPRRPPSWPGCASPRWRRASTSRGQPTSTPASHGRPRRPGRVPPPSRRSPGATGGCR